MFPPVNSRFFRALRSWWLALLLLQAGLLSSASASPTLYSIGDPTDKEQFYLEMINRARANPGAEGQLLKNTSDPGMLAAYTSYGVDLNVMASEFAAISPAPPLSMNAQLLASARAHSQDMLQNAFQSHTGSNGSTFTQRITAQGYTYQSAAENIYAYSKSPFYGHAGFEVDWGPGGTYGMQSPRGHRNNIHNATFREVGVGNVEGTNGSVGPELVTQDFGVRFGSTPFVTGVAYYDLNGNNFYDPGEGVGGVWVDVAGASYYAVTAGSGGYSVPVPGNGSYQTTYSAASGSPITTSRTVSSLQNVKADLILDYIAPGLTGPSSTYAGLATAYTFTPVWGATGYQLRRSELIASPASEGAENGSSALTINASAYEVIQDVVKDSGAYAFHLAHPMPAVNQHIALNRVFRPRSNASISFRSRLGWATPTQIAQVQVSQDQGQTWQTFWSQSGTDNQGETSFQTRTVSLASLSGQAIQIRFLYSVSSSFYYQTSSGVGWYIDGITFNNIDELTNSVVTAVPAGSQVTFVPPSAKTYVIDLCPDVSGRYFPYGASRDVAATSAPAGSYAAWQIAKENQNGLAPGTLSDRDGDTDGDGVSNVVEFGFETLGFSPGAVDAWRLPVPSLAGTNIVLDYPRDTAKTGLTYVAEASMDLSTWYAPGDAGAPSGFIDTLQSTTGSVQNRRASVPISSGAVFLRIRLISTGP